MEIKRVKTSELKFDKELLKVAPSVSASVPVIVDRENNVIFGDNAAMKAAEIDVVVVDTPFAETRLAMHATGRWAEPNWTKLKASEPPKYGYTAFIDGFLFKEVPQKLGLDRHPEKSAEHLGDLF
jgi:hypothetical protein